MPLVSVVVVTWQARDLTLRCLASVREQVTPFDVELVVVDNASTDGTVAALEAAGDVRVLALPTNTGFAGGAAAGTRAARGDVVVLLNNDAVARPGWLAALAAPLLIDAGGDGGPGAPASPAAPRERVGATTGRVLLSGLFVPAGPRDPDALVAVDGARWTRGPEGVTLVNSTGNEVTRSGNGRDRGWLTPADGPAAPPEVFGLNGGCAALSRAALDDVGTFEESLFLYYEDTELSWRLRRRGWGVRHVPEAVTVHDHAASTGAGSRTFLDHNERNRLLVALVHAPWPVVARAWGRAAVRAVLGPQRGRRLRVLARALGRLPWCLARRRAVQRTATVPRAEVARLLVADGARR